MLYRAYKFRLYPDEEQQTMFAKTFGCCRFVYNQLLQYKKEKWENEKESVGRFDCSKYCNHVLKEENEWLREVDSYAINNAITHLDAAYQKFFKENKGYPRFKSKHDHHNSYTTYVAKGKLRLADGKLKLPKVGEVAVVQHRPIPEGFKAKSITVSQNPSGKYYASILLEYESDVTAVEPKNVLGIGFSAPGVYVDSNGNAPEFSMYYQKYEEKLKREQQKLSRKQKGSANYEKQRIKLARTHEKIANKRKDYLHKLTKSLADTYDCICVEDINIKDVAKTLGSNKAAYDAGWGMFITFLQYKLEEQGKTLVKIDSSFLEHKDLECAEEEEWHARALEAANDVLTAGMELLGQSVE